MTSPPLLLLNIGQLVTLAATDDQLLANLRHRADTFMRYGTTTFEAKTGYGLSTSDELRSLATIDRLRLTHPARIVPTFLGAHAVPAEYRALPDEYVAL